MVLLKKKYSFDLSFFHSVYLAFYQFHFLNSYSFLKNLKPWIKIYVIMKWWLKIVNTHAPYCTTMNEIGVFTIGWHLFAKSAQRYTLRLRDYCEQQPFIPQKCFREKGQSIFIYRAKRPNYTIWAISRIIQPYILSTITKK